eukprot:6272827-Prymnesium_polylepis.1
MRIDAAALVHTVQKALHALYRPPRNIAHKELGARIHVLAQPRKVRAHGLLIWFNGLQAKGVDELRRHQIGQSRQARDAYILVDAHRVLVARQDVEPVHSP